MKAWTGGTHPAPFNKVSTEEKKLVFKFFRQQLNYWKLAWGNRPPDKDTELLFFNRARYDAHATCNQQ